ncbi:MAG: succinic semialdehyde dehydrogenase [Persicimonas sp.]
MASTTTLEETDANRDDQEANERRVIECHNPANGQFIAEIQAATPDEIDEAASTARQAFRSWRRLDVKQRCDILLDVRDVLLDHRRELLELLQVETGKAQLDAQSELLTIFETLRYYASKAPEFLADETVRAHLFKNKRVSVQYAPMGVVVNISPWNFPLELSVSPAIPALAAGNAVLIKPSEHTPLSAIRAVELMNEAGLPEGLLQVVPGYGDVGAALCEKADSITFTGSVPTGRKVAHAAAERLVPCTLELGGKDPAIVLDDADLERTVNGIVWGSFFNAGQVCLSVERAYVHDDVYEEFVDRVVRKTRRLRQGDPGRESVDVGAMIDPAQKETIERLLDDAVDKGARILTGGNPREGTDGDFFEPTVVVDVDQSMAIMREETFGPVLPIMRVSSAFEAIQLANDSNFGLGSSVWTTDKRRARDIARQLEAGQVWINDIFSSYAVIEAPYGGIKESGIGRRKSRDELRKYVYSKTVLEDILNLDNEPYWYPYKEVVSKGVNKALGVLFQRGITSKLSDLFKN